LKVSIINRQNKIKMDLSLLKKVANYVADKFDSDSKTELNIIFVDRDEIRQLNKKYRNKDIPTDVLSFSYNQIVSQEGSRIKEAFDREHGFSIAGEIIISPEVACENINSGSISGSIKNSDNEWDLDKELSLLIIHGILHMYNYDHEKRNDKIDMESLQSSLLNDVRINFSI